MSIMFCDNLTSSWKETFIACCEPWFKQGFCAREPEVAWETIRTALMASVL